MSITFPKLSTSVLVASLAVLASSCVASAQQNMPPDVPRDLQPYQLVLFRSTDPSPPSPDLLQRHLAYMRRMTEEKHYVVYGPATDGGAVAGMAVLRAPSADSAKVIVGKDPMVVAGRMTIDVHSVMLPSLNTLVVRY